MEMAELQGRELLLYSNNRNHQSSILTVEIQKKERKELGLLAFSTSMDKHTKVGGVSHAIFWPFSADLFVIIVNHKFLSIYPRKKTFVSKLVLWAKENFTQIWRFFFKYIMDFFVNLKAFNKLFITSELWQSLRILIWKILSLQLLLEKLDKLFAVQVNQIKWMYILLAQ